MIVERQLYSTTAAGRIKNSNSKHKQPVKCRFTSRQTVNQTEKKHQLKVQNKTFLSSTWLLLDSSSK